MLSDGTNTFTWNARDQVATLNNVSLQYDAFGRRTQNLLGTSFLYDGANAAQELSGTTATANMLTGGIDEFFNRTDSSGSFTPLRDPLGSTIALVDGSGNIATSYTYDPFGNTTVSGALSGNPSQYTGRENEGNGLYFYRARYYSPLLGRFISEDPLGFLGGDEDLYAYAAEDPMDFSDASGLKLDPKPGVGAQGGLDYADYLSALQYLTQDPKAAAVISKLDTRHRVFPVVFIHNGKDRFDPTTSTIYWDPRSALGGCDHGGKQTPALGLYHEMAHALGDGPKARAMANTPDRQYDTREERRVIRTYEVPFAVKHGEGIRHSHGGNPYDSIGPTSTEPAVPTRNGPALPIPPGLQRLAGRAPCGCN